MATGIGRMFRSERAEHAEGRMAHAIEEQTARLPSDAFLWTALGAIGISAALQVMGRSQAAQFVGQWAPTVLILGLYNKVVKVFGSEAYERQ